MQTYFAQTDTVNAVRALFRKLAMQFHPDRGGDLETMKQINLAYEAKLASLNGETTMGTDGKTHTYYYNETVEHEAMAKVLDLLGLGLDGITIEMIGQWVWVSGDTKPVKDQLKAQGMRWHSKRQMWYWRMASYRTRYNKRASIDDLREIYGAKTYENQSASAMATA